MPRGRRAGPPPSSSISGTAPVQVGGGVCDCQFLGHTNTPWLFAGGHHNGTEHKRATIRGTNVRFCPATAASSACASHPARSQWLLGVGRRPVGSSFSFAIEVDLWNEELLVFVLDGKGFEGDAEIERDSYSHV